MSRVEIYLETIEGSGIYEALDLFKDENIEIQFKQKDKNDIAKVFSTFSKSFTVPASDNNKRLIRYLFNSDVVRDKNGFINSKIYINKNLFKSGKIKVDNQSSKNFINKSITLTFFTVASTLKTLIGDDKLSSLSNDIQFNWKSSEFINYIPYYKGINDFFIPLISNYRVWSYGSDTNDIKYINSSTTYPKAINYNELRPALKYSLILDGIASKYNINNTVGRFIDLDIIDEKKYEDLFVHLTSKELLNVNAEINLTYDFNWDDTPFYDTINVTYATASGHDIYTIERLVGATAGVSEEFAEFQVILPINAFNNQEYSGIINYIDMRVGPTYGDILFSEKLTKSISGANLTSGYNFNPYDIKIGSPLIFRIEFNFNNVLSSESLIYRLVSIVNGTTYITSSINNNYNINKTVNLFSLIPDMKVIDFLSSFFKMFNISVIEDINGKLFFNTTENNDIKDFTDYISIDNVSVAPKKIFKTYKFTYLDSKYKSNEDYKLLLKNNSNSNAFGQLLYKSALDYSDGEYVIESKYSLTPFVDIPDTSISTQYAFTSEDTTDVVYGTKYTPNYNEFNLFYVYGATESEADLSFYTRAVTTNYGVTSSLGFRNEETSLTVPIYQYTTIGICDYDATTVIYDISGPVLVTPFYTNSLGFKDEVFKHNYFSSYNSIVCSKNLYSNYYQDLISDINNPNSFLYTFEGNLPAKEVTDFKLTDNIIIGNNKYKVEEANIDIVSGKTKFLLSNIT